MKPGETDLHPATVQGDITGDLMIFVGKSTVHPSVCLRTTSNLHRGVVKHEVKYTAVVDNSQHVRILHYIFFNPMDWQFTKSKIRCILWLTSNAKELIET